jgi:hypothetical protein
LVDQVESNLRGFTLDQDEQTFLTSAIDADALTIPLDEARLISRGIVQIGDELVWVKGIDQSTSSAMVSPFGRGYLSTTAATHDTGTAVVDNPKFPRARIRSTIQTAVREVYPDLYPVASTEIPYVAARNTYALPAATRDVLSVHWQVVGPSRSWNSVKRWNYNPRANTDEFPTGKTIDLWGPITPGRTVQVDYITEPGTLDNDSDEFTTATGLGADVEEAVVYGTCYRMVGWLETPRLQIQSVESSMRSQLVPPKSATDAGKFFYAMYQESLSRARMRLLREHPTSLHFRYV